MLDVRLMCWHATPRSDVRGRCQPDCFGPFREFWNAIGDMAAESRVLGLQEWASGADVRVAEAIFATKDAPSLGLAWGAVSSCTDPSTHDSLMSS